MHETYYQTCNMDKLDTTNQSQNTNLWDIGENLSAFNSRTLDLIAFEHIKKELEKYNDWNHFFIIHQTTEDQAIKILQSPYFSNTWLNWTSLISNLDWIINASCYLDIWQSWPWFQLHKDSNSLVIMVVSKDEFKDARSLPDIDSELTEYIDNWEINSFWLPNRCIWWYIRWVSYHSNQNFTWKIIWQ